MRGVPRSNKSLNSTPLLFVRYKDGEIPYTLAGLTWNDR